MIFKTEYKPEEELEKLIASEDKMLEIAIREVASELSEFIIKKVPPVKTEEGIYTCELFISSKDQWIKLRKLLSMYAGPSLPYEIESLLLSMEQQ